ncbi:MAG: hypothetical protein VKS61_07935 [Candidatus Sericytochromatia bacterium]|nr:hypothetical protein [Candidatus Sericytochromatia bacterium]
MQAPDASVPNELVHLRQWLDAVFAQARTGLPWPEQLALRVIEGAFAAGVFGAALLEAWRLEALHRTVGDGAVPARLAAASRSLEVLAFGPLGPTAARAWREFLELYPGVMLASHAASGTDASHRSARSGTPRVVR